MPVPGPPGATAHFPQICVQELGGCARLMWSKDPSRQNLPLRNSFLA